jgi:hypothetical protein
MQTLVARQQGARIRAGQGVVARPCEPDDVVRELDRLYRQRRIELEHVRILRVYGERGHPPDPKVPAESYDARLWREVTERLNAALRLKGIVAAHLLEAAPGG